MGVISFLKEAGEKLLHAGPAKQNAEAQQPQASPVNIREKEQALERAILDYMAAQNLPIENLVVAYDSSSATVTVSGSAPDQATREKIVLCCGNVQGVAHVNDQINVAVGARDESKWYEVKSGDTLSKIAKQFYGDANRYSAIFEANKPMLTDPDKIYPGQMLRIPAQH
ncbi:MULTISPECIES: peptidoglycan-binding protein LysM [Oxalobacteraceae]|uniref:peptidoglycan-binding protein LysM n=1 Tax=Oxalobacteraceae TaxID=75682 RepID=UPI0010A3D632|nr:MULTISPECIES: peptidoglycan-binding protein LysM [Oxalobacteraceae]HJV83140.1 peptidoglycan-binding protein LysM [Noviherbaspirillum sp.]